MITRTLILLLLAFSAMADGRITVLRGTNVVGSTIAATSVNWKRTEVFGDGSSNWEFIQETNAYPTITTNRIEVIEITRRCEKCPTGWMRHADDLEVRVYQRFGHNGISALYIISEIDPPVPFLHRCTACTNTAWLSETFPRMQTNRIAAP